MCGPDVAHGPLALLSGKFEEKAAKAAAPGYDGIDLMVRDLADLDWRHVKTTLQTPGWRCRRWSPGSCLAPTISAW